LKIIYFSLDYTPHDHRFLSALAETEHQVYYVRLQRRPRQTEDRPVPSKIEQVIWVGGQKPFAWKDLPRLAFDFRRLTRQIKPDLIHAGPIQTCGLIAAWSGFRPRLSMSWGYDLLQDADRNWRLKRITQYVLRNTDFFTCDCETTRQKAIAYGVNPSHTTVFPWGVDLQRFTPPVPRPPSPFTVLCTRSWEPLYGVDVVAKAFVKAAKQRPEIQLLLLGGGSQGNLLRQILTNGGMMERVTFGGQVSQNELPRYYQMADLYVSASHVDGSSVSLMEALACGLPSLVSDIPANREWVTDGANGWLFPDGDADALAATILHAVDERKKLTNVGRAARQTAEEKANWKKNFQKLLLAYEMTLKVVQR
jgi:glycosyltransferase involved in cell wall biosynthesis